MKIQSLLVAALLVTLVASAAIAQPPRRERDGERDGDRPRPEGREDGPRRGPPRDGERGPGPGPGGFMFRLPILAALDLDKNGELSAKEIEDAAKSLATLDKNEDGKITADELRPDFGDRGGPDGRFGRGPRDGDRPEGEGRPRFGRGPRGDREGGEGGDRPQRPRRPE